MSIETALAEMGPDVAAMKSVVQDGIPPDAVAFNATNAAVVDTAGTPKAIVAAPGSGKRIMLKQAVFTGPTANEVAVIHLEDTDGTVLFGPVIAGKTGAGLHKKAVTVKFNPPLRLVANKGLSVDITGSVGDSYVHATGYILG